MGSGADKMKNTCRYKVDVPNKVSQCIPPTQPQMCKQVTQCA